jgi:hypothetical protein
LTDSDSNAVEEARVAYFYCDFRKSESQSPVNVLGSLVAQLCAQSGWFSEDLKIEFDCSNSAGQRRRPSFFALRGALQSFSKEGRVILLIDALDECNKRNEVLEFISVVQEATENINILITSRDEPDIRAALPTFARTRLENWSIEMNRDIRAYLNHRLERDPRLQWLAASVKIDIARSLDAKSAGM